MKPNGLARERVANIQRARMLAAMAEVACELGLANVTVAHVVARSGVSRRTFYEHFAGREDCFLAAFNDAVERLATRVAPAYAQGGSWAQRIRAALQELLAFLDEEPYMAGLAVVQALGAGPAAMGRRQRALSRAVAAVDAGREKCRRGKEPPPLTAEGVVGAVFSVVHSRMLQPKRAPLTALTNELMSMIVLPYLGPLAARRELERSSPDIGRSGPGGVNPLKHLEMRLTYRTVRVLLGIGAHPGISNRKVGEAAGISDQGQISKLLARLDNLGLVENGGFGRAKGESNSWHLTPRGCEIENAIRAETERR